MKKEAAIQGMRAVMRRQHKAWKTEQSYVRWLERYMHWLHAHRSRLPQDSRGRIEAFLTDLAVRARVSGKTQNCAFHAVLFFYREVLKEKIEHVSALRAKTGERMRHAPSRADVLAMLDALDDANGYPIRLIVQLLYGCGLRVSEPLKLRVKDIRFDTGLLTVREAKGDKDRVVRIPDPLKAPLAAQIRFARGLWERDQAAGIPVQLSEAYHRKNARARREWGWYFVFPQAVPCRHPRTGERVRYHLHESNIQRAVRTARIRARITAPLTPHHLRHAYATHLHDAGVSARDLQNVLGHKSLETTMVYLTPHAATVRSPLEVTASVA